MKYSEFHRIIRRNGWKHIRTKGSHCFYRKGHETVSIPYHGSKEMSEGLRLAIVKKFKIDVTL